ncbi:hypothetical protein ACFP2T_12615 [Plantactinospora solaniradicis]|uniref:Uncharacterized protein n=1 Tax=Plantactinospora solaniradicis TaxID=1723736 RepID=A0ABW1K855_9ACTN
MRANADAEQGQSYYAEAAEGTRHTQIQEAITDVRTAAEKSAKIARLLDEAGRHLQIT